MPITAQTPEVNYTADGIATSYAYPFRIFAASDLVVNVAGVAPVLNVDYTVTGSGDFGGGQVVFTTPPAASAAVLIRREIPLDRSTDYTTAGPNRADILDDDLDRIVAQMQDRESYLSRTLKAMTFTSLTGGDVSVGSIAALRAMTPPASGAGSAMVQGYYVPGDGGGGPVRIWKGGAAPGSYVDNGGSVIVPAGGDGSGGWIWEYSGIVSVRWFGAVAGEVNSTARLQAAIDYCSATKLKLTGHDGVFNVTTVLIKANTQLLDIKLTSIGTSGVSPVSFIPVILIDGTITAKTNIRCENVIADGNRSNHPNINNLAGEDGGMHAWRFIGGVTDSVFVSCKGINAGSAGWAMHNTTPSTVSTEYIFQRLLFRDCDGTGNREHGMFADSFKDLRWIGGNLTGNGLDLNGTDPLSHGNRGARDTVGDLFGMPFDLECYGPNYFGSQFTDFLMQGTDCRGNSLMPTLYNPIASNLAGFVPARNIRLLDCDFDTGSASGADRPPNTDGLALNVLGNLVTVTPFIGLTVTSRLAGIPQYNGVSELNQSGGRIDSATTKAKIYNSKYFDVSCPSKAARLDIFPVLNLTFAKTAGAAGAVFSPILDFVRAADQNGVALTYSVSLTGGLASGGTLVYMVTPPAGFIVREIDSAFVTIASVPVRSSVVISPAGTATLYIDSSYDTNLTASVRASIIPSD